MGRHVHAPVDWARIALYRIGREVTADECNEWLKELDVDVHVDERIMDVARSTTGKALPPTKQDVPRANLIDVLRQDEGIEDLRFCLQLADRDTLLKLLGFVPGKYV